MLCFPWKRHFQNYIPGIIRESGVNMLSTMLGKYSYLAAVVTVGGLLLGSVAQGAQAQTSSTQSVADSSSQNLSKQNLSGQNLSTQSARQQMVANKPTISQAPSYQTLYVNPEVGSDSAEGVEARPLRTVTRALEVAPPNTVIVLAPGRYSQGTGEVFPLQLKPGVTIQGTPGSSDRTAIIEGGGNFDSPLRSRQNAAIIAADRAGIAQIAVSNPDGYGVWIESASPTILESAFVGNRQTGIYVAGGSPRVQGSYFSGNQVAGLIVFGASRANIQRNIFDATGDAIRVLDDATPEIVGNRITNNDAGLVVVGNARPVVRDNQLVGNRQDEVVATASLPNGRGEPPNGRREPVPLAAAPRSLEPIEVQVEPEVQVELEVQAEPEVYEEQLSLADNELPDSELADSAISEDQLPAGAPGAALQALQSGLALGPRVVTEDNPEAGSLIRNRRRRQRERSPEPTTVRPPVPVNNNRLAVPNTAIPLGSGSSSTVFSPPAGGVGSPPAPPSRAQALGLYYRVFVEASDPFTQDSIRDVVPDAFRTRFEGRTMMQVGAFPTEQEAEDRRRLLERNNFDVLVEYIR